MSYINFVEIQDDKRKTKQFYVGTKEINGWGLGKEFPQILAYIAFYPQWRRFVLVPNKEVNAVFDADCLREIADFCGDQTAEWRDNLKKEKEDAKI